MKWNRIGGNMYSLFGLLFLLIIMLIARTAEASTNRTDEPYEALKLRFADRLEIAGAGDRIAIDSMRLSRMDIENVDEMHIGKLEYNPKLGKFSALMFTPSDPSQDIEVEGRYEEMAEIAVVKERITRGQAIGEDDVTLYRIPARRMRDDMITMKAELIGKTAKSTLAPNRPITQKMIDSPAIIKKGDQIVLVYQKAGIEIKDIGIALSDAQLHQVFELRNVASNKTIRARAEKSGLALVNFMDVPVVRNEGQVDTSLLPATLPNPILAGGR